MTERKPYTMDDAKQGVELDAHWKKVFESGNASDTLICLEENLQRAAEACLLAQDELRDWARQDIANARGSVRP